ncbi:MAG: DUF308 domain-containing protein [Prevotella sp.]|jgi:uncharacterized membrane protein HdeD (DUF308 family)|nr:DUF308 domain-containing protein [Prevotella sp.]
MKILQSSFFRALTAIAIGVLLIKFPDNTVTGIVITIGVLFLLSGIISVLSYMNAKRHASDYVIYDAKGRQIAGQTPMFPIVGIGSIILGAILALMPSTFISFLMYVIGAILILGAIGQFMTIISARKFGSVSLFYWVCPSIILLAGLYLMIKPMSPLSTALYILGWLTLFYGIVEATNSMLFYFSRRQWEKAQASLIQSEEAEEIKEEGSKEVTDKSETPAADSTSTPQ